MEYSVEHYTTEHWLWDIVACDSVRSNLLLDRGPWEESAQAWGPLTQLKKALTCFLSVGFREIPWK